ncbi:hypothetical protein V1504DRAFT_497992 [Lipomyces starkeyi]
MLDYRSGPLGQDTKQSLARRQGGPSTRGAGTDEVDRRMEPMSPGRQPGGRTQRGNEGTPGRRGQGLTPGYLWVIKPESPDTVFTSRARKTKPTSGGKGDPARQWREIERKERLTSPRKQNKHHTLTQSYPSDKHHIEKKHVTPRERRRSGFGAHGGRAASRITGQAPRGGGRSGVRQPAKTSAEMTGGLGGPPWPNDCLDVAGEKKMIRLGPRAQPITRNRLGLRAVGDTISARYRQIGNRYPQPYINTFGELEGLKNVK